MVESRGGGTSLETAARAVEQLRAARAAVQNLATVLDRALWHGGRTVEEWNIQLLADELRAEPDSRPAAVGLRRQASTLSGGLNGTASELWQATGAVNGATRAIARGREVLAESSGAGTDGLRRQFDRLEAVLVPIEPAFEAYERRLRSLQAGAQSLFEQEDGSGLADRAAQIAERVAAEKGAIADQVRDLKQQLVSLLPTASADSVAQRSLDAPQRPTDTKQALQVAAASAAQVHRELHRSNRRFEGMLMKSSRIDMATTTEDLADNLKWVHNSAGGAVTGMAEAQGWAAVAKAQLQEVVRMAEGDSADSRQRPAAERISAIAKSMAGSIDAVIAPAETMRQQLEPLQALPGDLEQQRDTARQINDACIGAYRTNLALLKEFRPLTEDFEAFAAQADPGVDPVPSSFAAVGAPDGELSQAQYAGLTPRGTATTRAGEATTAEPRRTHARDVGPRASGTSRS